jgi:hypothetical protein
MNDLWLICGLALMLGITAGALWYAMSDLRTNAGTWRPGQPVPQPDMRFAGLNEEDPDGSDDVADDDDGGL